jgi:hypothetical protein
MGPKLCHLCWENRKFCDFTAGDTFTSGGTFTAGDTFTSGGTFTAGDTFTSGGTFTAGDTFTSAQTYRITFFLFILRASGCYIAEYACTIQDLEWLNLILFQLFKPRISYLCVIVAIEEKLLSGLSQKIQTLLQKTHVATTLQNFQRCILLIILQKRNFSKDQHRLPEDCPDGPKHVGGNA